MSGNLRISMTCADFSIRKQGEGKYGQNLASQGSSGDIDNLKDKSAAQAIIDQWYKGEIKNYSPFYGMANPNVALGQVGHLTQVLWKSTKKVGCATVKCPAGSIFSMPSQYTVCNYQPAGKSFPITQSLQPRTMY